MATISTAASRRAERQIKEWKEAGANYVRDWLSWNSGNPNALDEFDGQSEARDMSESEAEAEFIYEGMMEQIKLIKEHRCSICRKPLSENDRTQYEAEGGTGYPDCHEACAELEAIDQRLLSYARG